MVRNLLDRLRMPPERARDLAAVRRQLVAEVRSISRAGDEERVIAARMHTLREQIAELQGSLTTCGGCGRGQPAPDGIWEGGQCCSASTADLFRDAELAALCLNGTRPRHLHAPRERAAGCAFRGPNGCALPSRHRPYVCSRYFCKEARRELHRRGDLDRMEELIVELEDAFGEFLAARDNRLEDQELEALCSGRG